MTETALDSPADQTARQARLEQLLADLLAEAKRQGASAAEAYMIEDGKITYPVKGATLIGNGPDVLTRVSMVGNDLALDEGVGTCGKEGQSLPVGVGQPTLRVDALTVGGTATG